VLRNLADTYHCRKGDDFLSEPKLPPVIFFDAGGTLIEPRGSVGAIYQRIAARHGITSDAAQLQQDFKQAFALQPPLAFPTGLPTDELDRRERAWWRSLVTDVFAAASHHPAFNEFFDEVYEHFTQAEAWRVFDDVVPALQGLRACGIRLAAISNFDSRLEKILAATELVDYFDAVYYSTRCGAAKPDARIFAWALAQQGIAASEAWHVGDALREDVEGAQAVGIKAWLIDRDGASGLTRLDQLVGFFG
jgi:putative hydrolase of the HAD superfamily